MEQGVSHIVYAGNKTFLIFCVKKGIVKHVLQLGKRQIGKRNVLTVGRSHNVVNDCSAYTLRFQTAAPAG